MKKFLKLKTFVLATTFLPVAILALLTNVAVSHAGFIDILSQEYFIRGAGEAGNNGSSTGVPDKFVTYSYDFTSSLPVSFNHGLLVPPDASGGIQMDSSAQGTVTSDYASVDIFRNFNNLGNASIFYGDASAAITFSPLVNSMLLFPHIGLGLSARGTITDITDGSLLFSDGRPLLGPLFGPPVLLAFNLNHIYIMKVDSSGPYTIGGASLRIQAVPEPSSFLLLAVGLAALVARRRKRPSL